MNTTARKSAFLALIVATSMLSAFATVQLLDKDDRYSEPVFDQPVRLTNYQSQRGSLPDFTVAAENSVHAVVHIKSIATASQSSRSSQMDMFEWFFGDRGLRPRQQQPKQQVGFGSGVIISSDGYIVTNNHVIDGSDQIEVTMNDKRSFKAKLVGTDPNSDIALLKIEEKNLPVIPFGNSDELKVGQWVLAVGNPFNLTSTVTAGIVSAKARNINIISADMKIESFIQTDAAVNPGNSGGALVNTNGELVGINTAIASNTGNYAGYSFAVPVSIVAKIVADLKLYGSVQRAVLGVSIQDVTAEMAQDKKLETLEGVYVAAVSDRSSAKEAGIQEGDIITHINTHPVKSVAELQEQVSRFSPGDKIKVALVRGKDKKVMSVTLKNRQGNTSITKTEGVSILGAAFKNADQPTLQRLGISAGVEVTGVTDGKFKDNNIRKGFIILKVNNEIVRSVEQLESITADLQRSASDQAMFIVGVYPNGKISYYAIDLSTNAE